MTATWRKAVVPVAVGAVVCLGPAGPAGGQTPEPYRDPPFTCEVIDYGTEPPTLPAPAADPLCVRYDKTNITVSTLGVIDFIAAEPGRVAIFAGKCSYWQQDRWSIRLSPDTPPLLSWAGSYWYDAASGSAGGVLRDLRVADQPATGDAFIEALRPLVGDEQADAFRAFTDPGGGGGLTMALPEGFGAEFCAPAAGPAPPPGSEAPPAGPPAGEARVSATTTPSGGQLPATGRASPATPGVVLVLLAAVARSWSRAAC